MKNNNIQSRHFLLTDVCLWEQNKQNGVYHPHAIQVVDTETGQVRHIKSGSLISFISGEITAGLDQENYNKLGAPERKTKSRTPPRNS